MTDNDVTKQNSSTISITPSQDSASVQATSSQTQQTSKGAGGYPDKDIAVIGDEDTTIGFGLTGIKNYSIIKNGTEKNEVMELIHYYYPTNCRVR